MPYCRLEDGAADHPKIKKLARELDVPRAQALGHMCALWSWCVRFAPDGRLDGFDERDIAEAALWPDDASFFVEALLELKLLDNCGPYLEVHGYYERSDTYKNAQRKRKSREVSRDGHKTVTGQSRDKAVTVTQMSHQEEREEREEREEKREKKERANGHKTMLLHLALLDHYNKTLGKRCKTISDRGKKLIKSLSDKYDEQELKWAIDGLKVNQVQSPDGVPYDAFHHAFTEKRFDILRGIGEGLANKGRQRPVNTYVPDVPLTPEERRQSYIALFGKEPGA